MFAGDEQLLLKLPTNFHEAQAVKATLMLYKEACSGLVVALLISLYLFLQVCFCMWADFMMLALLYTFQKPKL